MLNGPEGKELGLVGVFVDDLRRPESRQSQLLSVFPLNDGGWRVYRFSPGVSEADTWSQDGQGWTTCCFNRRVDLATAAKRGGGIEDPDRGGYVFKSPDEAVRVAKMFGQDDIAVDAIFADRKTTLKATQGQPIAVVEIERHEGDAELKEPGRVARQGAGVAVHIFETN